jgi:hypothetical protein
MLEEEKAEADKQAQHEAEQRSRQEAEALRRQQEAERQQYEAQKQQLYEQQQAETNTAGQASRQQSWYTKPIGIYNPIKPIDPRGGGQ